MKALLVILLMQQTGVKMEIRMEVSDIPTCHTSGELISKDLEFKVEEVSYRCVDAEERGGILYIVEAPK